MLNSQKIALVTGATRGIGKAIAKSLAQTGIIVIGTATTEDGAMHISEYLHEFDGVGIMLDVANKDNIKVTLKNLLLKYGNIGILVNNAGITRDTLFLRMKEDDWDSVMDTNLKSIFLLAKIIAPDMIKNKFGRIVNITGLVGFTGNTGQVNYTSSKSGLTAFSKSLAQELGNYGITVNCVAPGFIQTDMTNILSEDVQRAYLSNIPLGRFGNVDDVANSVNFLISNEASYITGTTIHVNGGMYM